MTDPLFDSEPKSDTSATAEELTPEEQKAQEKAEKEKEKEEELKASMKDAYDAMEEARNERDIADIPLNDGYWAALQEFQAVARQKSLNFNPPPEESEESDEEE